MAPKSGIIPARAGFTAVFVPVMIISMDHPRSRGVYPVREGLQILRFGSSPLARGLPGGVAGIESRIRIIPARAGFTRPGTAAYSPSAGSSPLARGLRCACGALGCGGGIIPARAGFTTRLRARRWSARDHPRSRGVYSRPRSSAPQSLGSSPLARGLRVDKKPAEATPGIIPARAGFTLK